MNSIAWFYSPPARPSNSYFRKRLVRGPWFSRFENREHGAAAVIKDACKENPSDWLSQPPAFGEYSLPRNQDRRPFILSALCSRSQRHHGDFAVGHNLIASSVGQLLGRGGTIHIHISGCRSDKQQVRLNPIAFAVDVRINPVRPFRAPPSAHGGNVMCGCANPDFASLISLVHVPDSNVVPLGKCVQ